VAKLEWEHGVVEMDILGKSLVVLGVAFVISGLVLMLPTRRKKSAKQPSLEESQERSEYYLQQMREERREL
jgi:preprotein translocase subunit SecG